MLEAQLQVSGVSADFPSVMHKSLNLATSHLFHRRVADWMADLRRFFTVAQELLRSIFCAVEIDTGRSFTGRLRCSMEL
jgi:hypothetical protein